MSQEIRQALRDRSVNGQLSCEDAQSLAEQFGVGPVEIGAIVNQETEVRFFRCQLGLFGYGDKVLGQSKIVLRATHVPPEIEAALREHVRQGRIPCADVWSVAERFAYPRLGMANIAEAMGLKVAPCQLGCF